MEGSNLTVKQFNTSWKIASKLDVTVSIFEPADGGRGSMVAHLDVICHTLHGAYPQYISICIK